MHVYILHTVKTNNALRTESPTVLSNVLHFTRISKERNWRKATLVLSVYCYCNSACLELIGRWCCQKTIYSVKRKQSHSGTRRLANPAFFCKSEARGSRQKRWRSWRTGITIRSHWSGAYEYINNNNYYYYNESATTTTTMDDTHQCANGVVNADRAK